MELLWQKESTNQNAMYKDLLKDFESNYPEVPAALWTDSIEKERHEKKNAFSDQRRKEGNEEYRKGNFNLAIKYYNESLCLAETGTEQVAFALGNRSACFFELKLHDKCIIDIDLALEETSISDGLRNKLENRRGESEGLLPTVVVNKQLQVKLGYEASKNYPFMANTLHIQRNDEFGRHIIAKVNIPAGTTIAIEDNFIKHTKAKNYINGIACAIKCITCNRITVNPIQCPTCPVVMFCSKKCRAEDKIHLIDCGAFYYTNDNHNHKYIVQSVLTGIVLFPNVDALMKFVQEVVAGDSSEIPTTILDDKSKYRLFLKLWMPPTMNRFLPIAYRFFNAIMRIDYIKKKFNTLAKERFLLHLVAHHAVILLNNAMEGQLSMFASLLSHSCSPNVQEIFVDNRTVCITIRPIKKDEQIYCAYVTADATKFRQVDHRQQILERFGFLCKCLKCEDNLPSVSSIKAEPQFKQIRDAKLNMTNKKELEKFIADCAKLLNDYKKKVYCLELDYVSKRLGYCLGMLYYAADVK